MAKQRQLGDKKIDTTLPSKEGRVKGEVTEIVASKIGLSRGTLDRALVVVAEADEETKKKIRKGEESSSPTVFVQPGTNHRWKIPSSDIKMPHVTLYKTHFFSINRRQVDLSTAKYK